MESLNKKNIYYVKIVDVYNDGNELFYNCYMLSKLHNICIEDNYKVFVPKLRKELYKFFTKEISSGRRSKMFHSIYINDIGSSEGANESFKKQI